MARNAFQHFSNFSLAIVATITITLVQPAHAKRIDFKKSLFGIELSGLGMKSPKTALIQDIGNFSSEYINEFGFGMFFDLGGVIVLRPFVALMTVSDNTAIDTDDFDGRAFSQTLTSSGLAYGARISLAPYISDSARRRFYFGGGGGIVNISIARQRTYASGALETNSQEAAGSALFYDAHIGYEFFLVQNYSFGIELGYRRMEISDFKHESGTDMRGVSQSEGELLKDDSDSNEGFNLTGPTVTALFRLHF